MLHILDFDLTERDVDDDDYDDNLVIVIMVLIFKASVYLI